VRANTYICATTEADSMSDRNTKRDDEPKSVPTKKRWTDGRTTFQRVYDVLVGTTEPKTAGEFAAVADCSENAARNGVEQLVEMDIATKTTGRPATYRRNQSYFVWKRIETIAKTHTRTELRDRLDELIAADSQFQDQYGVPTPDAVTAIKETDHPEQKTHEEIHTYWDELTEWQTVRRDITVVSRALQRIDDAANEWVQA